jgi:hypothetical protein
MQLNKFTQQIGFLDFFFILRNLPAGHDFLASIKICCHYYPSGIIITVYNRAAP